MTASSSHSSRLSVAACSSGTLLWSLVMARRAGAVRIVGIAGVVIGGGVLLGLLTGQLRLDVHGFAVMTIAKAAWIVSVGWLLLRKTSPGVPEMP